MKAGKMTLHLQNCQQYGNQGRVLWVTMMETQDIARQNTHSQKQCANKQKSQNSNQK